MQPMTNVVSFSAVFIAGLLTFLSPCILPLVPAYISYITGVSFDELKGAESRLIRKKALVHSLFFVLGFSLVFIALGASATRLGTFLVQYRTAITKVGGALVIIFGLYLMGVFRLSFFDRERKITFKLRKGSKFGAFLLGVTFAAAWTPCIGPILGSILTLAATKETVLQGVGLLGVYSLGIAVPFIISAFLINTFLSYFAVFKKYMPYVRFICGLLLVIMGLLLLLRLNVI